MKVLLSIKPEFAHKIFDGEKKYEFRRSIFKRPVKKVIVYASAPISKVIGEFEIDTILYDDLSALWDKTSEFAGIEERYFLEYFIGKECGYAIRIKKTKAYDKHLCIKEHFQLYPPQSFAYVSDVKKKSEVGLLFPKSEMLGLLTPQGIVRPLTQSVESQYFR